MYLVRDLEPGDQVKVQEHPEDNLDGGAVRELVVQELKAVQSELLRLPQQQCTVHTARKVVAEFGCM